MFMGTQEDEVLKQIEANTKPEDQISHGGKLGYSEGEKQEAREEIEKIDQELADISKSDYTVQQSQPRYNELIAERKYWERVAGNDDLVKGDEAEWAKEFNYAPKRGEMDSEGYISFLESKVQSQAKELNKWSDTSKYIFDNSCSPWATFKWFVRACWEKITRNTPSYLFTDIEDRI